jgi:hypothetical protein
MLLGKLAAVELPPSDFYFSKFSIPETPSTFHPRAQRNAFRRREARPQSRSFARWNESLRRSPNSNRVS